MSDEMPRVLFVDDDENVLAGVGRHLRKAPYVLHTAPGTTEALEMIDRLGPYALVVSDLRMPGRDGIELLAEIEARSPQTVRILLTGAADLQAAVRAVNEGRVFRFLTKPCPADELALAVAAGVEQHRLMRAEREVLERTLIGSVQMLTDLLAAANPAAFGRASRCKELVRELVTALNLPDGWRLELAAMLSQVGLLALPASLVEHYLKQERLTAREMDMLNNHPALGRQILTHVPRLAEVAEIVGRQGERHDGTHDADDMVPRPGQVLKIALDYDELTAGGAPPETAVELMRHRKGWYHPRALEALIALKGSSVPSEKVTMTVEELRPGIVVAQDIYSQSGTLLVAKDQVLTPALYHRLRAFTVGQHEVTVHRPPDSQRSHRRSA